MDEKNLLDVIFYRKSSWIQGDVPIISFTPQTYKKRSKKIIYRAIRNGSIILSNTSKWDTKKRESDDQIRIHLWNILNTNKDQ